MNEGGSYQDFLKQMFNVEHLFEKPEPLKGIRVLEVCYVVLGPAACDYLAEFGAEVIKFEGQRGDQMRFVTPYAFFWKNMSPGLEIENHNKYWVGMHMGNPKAKEIFLDLVKKADVVVDNLTPGRMAEWGIAYQDLKKVNPRIIQLHVSGYGSWGPWTGRASYDAVAQSMGALSPITGFEDRGPIKSGVWIADWITGLMCAAAIIAALNYRERTGEGQFIDYLQVENVIRFLDWTWLYTSMTGENRKRSGNRDLAICPSDLFDCSDGWVAVAAFSKDEFQGLCQAMGNTALFEKYAEPLDRLRDENARELLSTIAAWVKTKKVEEVEALGNQYGFAATRVLEAKDAYHSEHFRERGTIQQYDDPLYGDMVQDCYPPRLSETPSKVKWSCRPLGFDNDYVLKTLLGFTTDKIKSLEEEGVIFKWNPKIRSHCPPPDWDGKKGIKLG
ncbi:CoA transferase [Desulforhabdus amnigena]|jgi:crotonobetainyl-CoA:carnitine CoA-transferase CaiB-like acyl-CoA transferase|uniref:CoA transferase n=1 Tax=Desulforhabdus amnigena TaxID=40218 RepID=A0A9W6FR45_9BACT|nr:CoA transferase [Desulforhabdus amnigena]NLJ28811.1 CoA transferase [Deltaproteobacteria bacterium]GLI33167.1 CoA transferase [Desulforhabdus amnigena]